MSEEKVQKELARYKDKKDIGKRHLPDGVSIRDGSLLSESSLSISQPSHSQGYPPMTTDIERIQTPSTQRSMTDYFLSMESSIFQTGSLTPTSDVSWLLRNIQYPDSLMGDTANSIESRLIFSPDFAVPRNTLSLVQGSNIQIAQVFRGLTFQLMRNIRPSIDRTMLLLPEQIQQELQEKPYDVVFFRLIMFLLMNNLTAEGDAVFENLFQQLRHFSVSQVENLLDMVPYPYLMALEQSILTIAIE
jgi:hypothetical protein